MKKRINVLAKVMILTSVLFAGVSAQAMDASNIQLRYVRTVSFVETQAGSNQLSVYVVGTEAAATIGPNGEHITHGNFITLKFMISKNLPGLSSAIAPLDRCLDRAEELRADPTAGKIFLVQFDYRQVKTLSSKSFQLSADTLDPSDSARWGCGLIQI